LIYTTIFIPKKKEPEVKHKLKVEQEPEDKHKLEVEHEPEAKHEAKLGEKRKAKGENNVKSNRRRSRKPDDFRDVDDLDTAQYYFEDGKEKRRNIIEQPILILFMKKDFVKSSLIFLNTSLMQKVVG
jgi:hypothetical protein